MYYKLNDEAFFLLNMKVMFFMLIRSRANYYHLITKIEQQKSGAPIFKSCVIDSNQLKIIKLTKIRTMFAETEETTD